MPFLDRLTAHQQRSMLAMAERLDDHFAKASFSSHLPVSYARLHTHVTDPEVRHEEMAFHFDELVALHSAVFDLPDIAFQGDGAIVGLAKRYAPEMSVTPQMICASYTFMQWLGTNVGRAFIRDLSEAFDEHDKLELHAADDQLNDIQRMLKAYFQSPSRCHQRPLNAEALGLVGDNTSKSGSSIEQSRYALLALSTYLNLQYRGTDPSSRNVFDYNMDPEHGAGFPFYADDQDQVVAMTLVAWIGTKEGAAHLRFLDAVWTRWRRELQRRHH